jgi:hypothetical protein
VPCRFDSGNVDPFHFPGVEPVAPATHDRGLAIKERYGFSLYDSMLVSSALIVGSKVLYSEDATDGCSHFAASYWFRMTASV